MLGSIRRSKFAILSWHVLIVSLLSVAQAAAADVSGTVKDATGGALPNVRIVIMTAQRAVVATATSDQDGQFRLANLADAD
jgi:hypothetical protein